MNRDQFFNQHRGQNIDAREMERKWMLRQREIDDFYMAEALAKAYSQQQVGAVAVGVGGGGGQVGGALLLEDSTPGSSNYLLQEDGSKILLQ